MHFIIDKSNNAGCYHNKILFVWKVHLPRKNLNLTFLVTNFSERQSGKDQCDRDSATAKRQMQCFIDLGSKIQNSNEMSQAMC